MEYYSDRKQNTIFYARGKRDHPFTSEEFPLTILRDISQGLASQTFILLRDSKVALQFQETYKLINLLLEMNTIAYSYGKEIADKHCYIIKNKYYLYPDGIIIKALREIILSIVNQIYIVIMRRTDKYDSLFQLDNKVYKYLQARFFSKKKLNLIKPYSRRTIYNDLANYAVRIAEEVKMLIEIRVIKEDIREYVNLAAGMNKIFLLIYWDYAVDFPKEFVKRAQNIRKEINQLAIALEMTLFS